MKNLGPGALGRTVLLTATGALVANTLNVINIGGSTGLVHFTLPSAPDDDTEVVVVRIDGSQPPVAGVYPSGTDGLAISSSTYLLYYNNPVTFVYRSPNWYVRSQGYSTLAGINYASTTPDASTIMIRDGSGRSQVVDPGSSAQDIATKNYVDTLAPNRFIDGGTKTAGFTAVVGTMYSINVAASLGAVTVTLPTAPAQGSCIAFARIDTNFYSSFVDITPGGADTMDGGIPFILSAGGATLIYQGTRWNVLGYGSGSFGGKSGASSVVGFPDNIMARNGSGQSEVNAPTSGLHVANKTYVDGAVRVVTTSTTANNRDTILANATSGNVTITVPITAGNRVVVKRTDNSANQVIVVAATGNVDGDANATLTGINASAVFLSDGTNLKIEAVYEAGITVTPAGVIEMFGGASAPTGYLLCDGSPVSRTVYANLFAAISTTYGVGDGSTTFNLPSFVNKFARGNTPGTGGGSDTHLHNLSDLGQSQVIVGGISVVSRGVTSASWTTTQRMTGTNNVSMLTETTGAALTGTTDSATAIPAYTGVTFIIKT